MMVANSSWERLTLLFLLLSILTLESHPIGGEEEEEEELVGETPLLRVEDLGGLGGTPTDFELHTDF